MFFTVFNWFKKQRKAFLGYLKKQEAVFFYGSILSYILAFFSFLICYVVPSWTLIKIFNILLLVFIITGALCSGLFNYLHFFYHVKEKNLDDSEGKP